LSPPSCKTVDGTIAAQGWCIVWRGLTSPRPLCFTPIYIPITPPFGRSLISAGPKIEIAAPYSDPDLIYRKS
jgi:hypothetical protein